MQTILGSGGAIGTLLAKELIRYTNEIRLVSRNPKKVNHTDALFPADLTDANQVDKAIEGADVVYLTLGFSYDIRVWKREWPRLMKNVINSCEKHHAKLVFFDNVYMYDSNHMHNLTEETPVKPVSKKGLVRAEIAGMILDNVAKGRIQAVIARSADFYGLKNSVLVEMVIKNLIKNKPAMWFADAHKIHTFTASSDAAKGTALLGNTPDAFNQVWHLPTSDHRLTGKEWIGLISEKLHVRPRCFTIPGWLLSIMGIFVPIFKEFKEMLYQYDRDYFFNSSKFAQRFGYVALSPEEGMEQLLSELTKVNR